MFTNMMKNRRALMFLGLVTLVTLPGAQATTTSSVRRERLESASSPFSPRNLKNEYTSWAIDPQEKLASINLAKAWEKYQNSFQKEIVVAVVDTGIDANHSQLKDNVFVASGKVSETNFGMDFSGTKETSTPTDFHGHGTHVAGIIKSVSRNKVKILALKYYNPRASGEANLAATIKALKYAVDNNVDVINYSGGGPEASTEELKILKEAEQKGILVVAAAGNEESNIDNKKTAYYPASYNLSNIISVTAHDQSLSILPSSNWGVKTVDISAPGYKVNSTIPNGIGMMTGTSQATAIVTGVAVLLKSAHPTLTAQQIKTIIRTSARQAESMKTKTTSGGVLDAASALEKAQKDSPALVRAARRATPGRDLAVLPQNAFRHVSGTIIYLK